jgi:hypothetical protein
MTNRCEESVTCKCGHTGTLRAFTFSQPWQVFKCPSCKYRFCRTLRISGEKSRVVVQEFDPQSPRFACYE